MASKKHLQLYLFTGENTYALTRELAKWKQAYLQKHGEVNLQMHAAEDLDWAMFLCEAQSAPFLAPKRLLILEGIPEITKEEGETLLAAMHEGTVLVISAPLLDRRRGIVKLLEKRATVHMFGKLTRQRLTAWLLALAKEEGAVLAPADAEELLSLVGEDQWHLEQELRKAIAHAQRLEGTIHVRRADIDAVCLPSGTHAAWTLSDLIGKGRAEEAVSLSRALAESGEDAPFLWNAVFLTIIKNIILLWMTAQEKHLPPAALARESGVHFLSVQSLLPFVRGLSPERVRAIVRSVLEADRALKTGELRASASEPIELQTMLERQILGLEK